MKGRVDRSIACFTKTKACKFEAAKNEMNDSSRVKCFHPATLVDIQS